MNISLLFTPKSNLKLKSGYFWPIKISDRFYAVGVVLAVPNKKEKSTKIFLAGLLDWTGASKPTQEILENCDMKLVDQGEVHIKTITIRGEQIEGRIDLEKSKVDICLEVDSSGYSKNSYVLKGFEYIAKATVLDHNCLSTRSTWGYEVINIKARKLLK